MSSPAISPNDALNQELLRNVRPPDWPSPETFSGSYNLVVIGGGTAGLVAAAGAATLGARVALIEKSLLGGDCTNFGCVPSKTLLHAARRAYACGPTPTLFADAMLRLREVRARISTNDSARRLRDLGVDVFFGTARFSGRHQIEVGDTQLSFRKAIIATGARAALPPIPGLKEARPLTNETVFSIEQLPPRLLVLGGGPLGCELAQAFSRLGSQVTVMERNPRLLGRDEAEAAALVERQLAQEGVKVVCDAQIEGIQTSGSDVVAVVRRGDGVDRFSGDAVLVSLGRVPNLEGMQLERAGVAATPAGVTVNDRLQTTNPDIFAAGDICSSWKFTHSAEAMARLAMQNALFGRRLRASKLVIPWCTYTDPEIAHVGLDAQEAEAIGARVFTLPLGESDRAIIDGCPEGFARLYLARRGNCVLGATFVGAHAGEVIAELALAVTRRLPVSALSNVIHPYPTLADAWKRAAERQLRSKLNPRLCRWLVRYFAWRR